MMLNADIVVVGAGPAGISAAVTAARSGRKTVLLEKEAFAGGIPVTGHIATLCGLYMGQALNTCPQMLYNAFVREFVDLLMRYDGVGGPVRMGKAYVLPFRPESFAAAARAFLGNEPALTVSYKTLFCSAEVTDGRIQSIEVDLNGRRRRINACSVIDATGDAAVCRAAGVSIISPDETRQVPAVIFPLQHVDSKVFSTIAAARCYMMIRHAVDRAALPPEAASVIFSVLPETPVYPSGLLVKMNLGRLLKNVSQTPEKEFSQKANLLKKAIVRFFKENVAGFEKCTTPAVASPVLHRESARGEGRYVLSAADVLSGRKFSDAVTKGCWPVEKWDSTGNCSVHYLKDGMYYDIPAGTLHARSVDNLFLAGKCISADAGAIASARVIGCCLATGEAAAKLAIR